MKKGVNVDDDVKGRFLTFFEDEFVSQPDHANERTKTYCDALGVARMYAT